jgi:hypothetical protein
VDERIKSPGAEQIGGRFNIWQIGGDALLKVKPNIPGYFILGGGARNYVPDSDNPPPPTGKHQSTSWWEPFGVLGAGIEAGARRRGGFRFELRVYFVAPAEQVGFDVKSMEIDLGLSLGLIWRP